MTTAETKNTEAQNAEAKTEPKVELTDKMKSVMETIEKMTVMELADLVKALEDKFGVKAAAAVSMAAMPAGGGAAAGAAPAEEKSTFNVVLTAAGSNKIQVIKELRTLTSLGLKEAKDLVDGAPKTVKEGATKEEADKIKKTLEGAGAKVELK